MDFRHFPVSVVLLVSLFCKISSGDHRVTNVPKAQCPGAWLFYNSHCYGFARDRLSWRDAELDCQSYGNGTHLASITHSMEGILIRDLIKAHPWKENIWLGLYDSYKNSSWKWVDGVDFQYKAWNLGAASKGEDEHCVLLLASRGYRFWTNVSCTRSVQYLCKYKI
ncbi:regenerating islet-derived protein 4-like [Ambystoma mexicanum]|uniref:regenerating islet-derived protein 4-like n=1 Tax=Ambystoma mexicanum TaxID=8296 RepID=UPI0037E8C514